VTAAAVVIVIVVLLAAVAVLALRRRPRQDDGLRSFRRHIDALSPEARREVQDRARRHDGAGRERDLGQQQDQDPDRIDRDASES
jgi:hypothetical protein